ncbi:MAG TPA: tetratricopeptide repeat protein [Pyrinomonadaceae bacterium]
MFSLPRSRQLILSVLAVVFVVICVQLAAAQVDDIGDGETDPVKLFERGQNAHARNDLVTALALYEAALKLRPEFPEAEFQRGVALAALDRSGDAEKAFTRAIELRKDWVLPYGALGNLLTHQSRDKEAEPFLRRALQLGAKDFGTLDALSAVRFRAGDTKEALALAQRATEDENASASAWAWRASIEDATGNREAALSSLEHALQLEPNHLVALKERARLRTSSGAYDAAIEDLKKALSLKPGDKEISLQLAQAYGLAGKHDEEQKILTTLSGADSSRPGAVIGTTKEIEAANSEDPKIAQPALEELIKKNSKNATLLARLGEVTRLTDPQRSAESYRQANKIDPRNPKYAVGYAAALVQMRRFAEAEPILRRIIATAPNEYTAHANLALALFELKRFADALPEYEWLAASRPEVAATYFFIATAHDNLGEYEQALDAYEKFLSRADPIRNKLDIEKINLRLPQLRDQIKRGQGVKRKKP